MNVAPIRTVLFAIVAVALAAATTLLGCSMPSETSHDQQRVEGAAGLPESEESVHAQDGQDAVGEGVIDLENGIIDVNIPCYARVQVLAYDPIAYEVTVQALSWENLGIVDGMEPGTEAAFVLDDANYSYDENPKEGDEFVASWVAKPDEMPHSIDSLRTLGDFWYQTALPWPSVWIESAAKGEFSEEDVSSLTFEELLRR